MAKPKKYASKKSVSTIKTPVPKTETVKSRQGTNTYRTLAVWWQNHNSDNLTILAGRFPKIHYTMKSRKRALDESGYRLIIRPPFQIYKVQHSEEVLNNPKKKEMQKKCVKNFPLINSSFNEHADFFKHHLQLGDQLKQYREMNAYTRARLGKVNKKHLNKASMIIFRLRQDLDGKKQSFNPIALLKEVEEEEPKKQEISIPKIKTKQVKKNSQNKFLKPRLAKIELVEDKKDVVAFDGFRSPKKEKTSVKLGSANKESVGDAGSQISAKSPKKEKTDKFSFVVPTVKGSSSGLSTPKRISRKASFISRRKKTLRPLSKTKDISKCTVNFPDDIKTDKKSNKYSAFGLLPSRPSLVPSRPSLVPSRPSLVPSRPSIVPSISKKSLVKSAVSSTIDGKSIDKKIKDSLEHENFLIVRPIQEKNIPSASKPFRLIDTEDFKISPQLLEKHGLDKLEPQYKYTEKYPGKTPSKLITLKKSRHCILKKPATETLRTKCSTKYFKNMDSSEALLNETEDRLQRLSKKREKLLLKIEKQANKGKNNRALNQYLIEKSIKLNQEIDQITKRINVRTRGRNLSEFMEEIAKKYS